MDTASSIHNLDFLSMKYESKTNVVDFFLSVQGEGILLCENI